MRHHLLFGALFLCFFPSFATWLILLFLIFDAAVLSLTDDVGCAVEAVGGRSSCSASILISFVGDGVGDSLGAEVGGRVFRRNDPDMLKEERDESDDMEGLGGSGED